MNTEVTKIEKVCPICHQQKISATAEDYCELCGMRIPDLKIAPKIQTHDGEFAFCCDRCKQIYEKIEKERGE
jgi:hypothetical protein